MCVSFLPNFLPAYILITPAPSIQLWISSHPKGAILFFSDCDIRKCLLLPSIDMSDAFIRREGKGEAYLHLELMKPSKYSNDGDETISATNVCRKLTLWQLLLSDLHFSRQLCEAGTTMSQPATGEAGAGRG